jgi:hypothetical protein
MHGAAAAKGVLKDVGAHFEEGVKVCEACRKMEPALSFDQDKPILPMESGVPDSSLMPCNLPFMQCRRCKDVFDRRIYYCGG